jgi:hypothetical protein
MDVFSNLHYYICNICVEALISFILRPLHEGSHNTDYNFAHVSPPPLPLSQTPKLRADISLLLFSLPPPLPLSNDFCFDLAAILSLSQTLNLQISYQNFRQRSPCDFVPFGFTSLMSQWDMVSHGLSWSDSNLALNLGLFNLYIFFNF